MGRLAGVGWGLDAVWACEGFGTIMWDRVWFEH